MMAEAKQDSEERTGSPAIQWPNEHLALVSRDPWGTQQQQDRQGPAFSELTLQQGT